MWSKSQDINIMYSLLFLVHPGRMGQLVWFAKKETEVFPVFRKTSLYFCLCIESRWKPASNCSSAIISCITCQTLEALQLLHSVRICCKYAASTERFVVTHSNRERFRNQFFRQHNGTTYTPFPIWSATLFLVITIRKAGFPVLTVSISFAIFIRLSVDNVFGTIVFRKAEGGEDYIESYLKCGVYGCWLTDR